MTIHIKQLTRGTSKGGVPKTNVNATVSESSRKGETEVDKGSGEPELAALSMMSDRRVEAIR